MVSEASKKTKIASASSKGKDKVKSKPAPVTNAEASSIDDIFASAPGPSKRTASAAAPTAQPEKAVKKKKVAKVGDEKKAGKIGAEKNGVSDSSKSRVVEVVDTSIPIVATSTGKADLKGKGKGEANGPGKEKEKGKKRDRKEAEDEDAFKDSRGTGPRRKTEEGFLIYKEAELGIDPEAGGTPLCPFDCDCCF